MILRFLFNTVLMWILGKLFGRFIPIFRRVAALFRQ